MSYEYLKWLREKSKRGKLSELKITKTVFIFIVKIFDKLLEGYIYKVLQEVRASQSNPPRCEDWQYTLEKIARISTLRIG